MKLNDYTNEELKTLSYTDLTYVVLRDENCSLSTPVIFKKICDLLDYSSSDYENKIGDYYTSLTLDKRFVLLDSHEWDLRERHAVELVSDDEDEEEEIDTEESFDEDTENTDGDIDADIDDDLDDLAIVDDSDEEEEI